MLQINCGCSVVVVAVCSWAWVYISAVTKDTRSPIAIAYQFVDKTEH